MNFVNASRRSPDAAQLMTVRRPKQPTAVVLVVHGGRSMSSAVVRASQVAVLRLRPIARAVARGNPTMAVYRLQSAVRGWNGTGAEPMRDARWALECLRADHPGVPIVLVGHSMGGRTSFRIAGDADVAGVVGLAPWLPADEPVRQLENAVVRIVHGNRDRIVPEPTTRAFLNRLRQAGVDLQQTIVTGSGHAMLGHWNQWNALAAAAVHEVAGRSGRNTEHRSTTVRR